MRRFPAPFALLLRERPLCGALLGAGVILAAGNALGYHLWHCTFLEITGRPCPGCGLTRGVNAFCRGDVTASVRWHPFSPAFVLGGLIMVLSLVLPTRGRQRLIDSVETIEKRTGLTAVVLIAMLAFGLWRIFTGRMPGQW